MSHWLSIHSGHTEEDACPPSTQHLSEHLVGDHPSTVRHPQHQLAAVSTPLLERIVLARRRAPATGVCAGCVQLHERQPLACRPPACSQPAASVTPAACGRQAACTTDARGHARTIRERGPALVGFHDCQSCFAHTSSRIVVGYLSDMPG